MKNTGDIAAFMAYQTDKSKQPGFQAAYLNSPAMLAHKKQMAGVKGVSDGAKAVYDKGGDQALADYYLNADKKYAVRGQTNPAKLVKAGKTTFQAVAKQEQEEMKAAAAANAASGNTGNQLLYENGEFNFALGGSGNSPNQAASVGSVNTKPVNTRPAEESSSQPKYSWQQGKEKAQAWQAENDKVNAWKKSYNQNTGQGGFKQYDFSSKNFTGN